VPHIRCMREEDVEAVIRVDAAAFAAWWKQSSGVRTHLPRRTLTNVLSSREKEPLGCFVADVDGRVVGAVMSRTWGSVGWLGALAVQPEHQRHGIGRELLAAGLDYLRKDGRCVVGLETMPETPHNVDLYLRLGFEPRFLTLFLERPLPQAVPSGVDLPAGFALLCWSQADVTTQQRWLTELQEATGQIYPGLDYSKEILGTACHSLGDTLVLVAGSRAVGLSTVWLTDAREGWNTERANLQVAALHPGCTHERTFRALLEASEALALGGDKLKLMLPVNARHPWALAQVLGRGYRVQRTMVRMLFRGSDIGASTDRHASLSRWSG
jgi:ribosomal protein S18 acetylase RimI-like enzyme